MNHVIVVVVVVPLHKIALVLKRATPQQRTWCVLHLVKKERDICATCILYTISHGTTQQSDIVCEMHVAPLLQSLSFLNAEHTNSSVVG
jgi:hypothetical protein